MIRYKMVSYSVLSNNTGKNSDSFIFSARQKQYHELRNKIGSVGDKKWTMLPLPWETILFKLFFPHYRVHTLGFYAPALIGPGRTTKHNLWKEDLDILVFYPIDAWSFPLLHLYFSTHTTFVTVRCELFHCHFSNACSHLPCVKRRRQWSSNIHLLHSTLNPCGILWSIFPQRPLTDTQLYLKCISQPDEVNDCCLFSRSVAKWYNRGERNSRDHKTEKLNRQFRGFESRMGRLKTQKLSSSDHVC